MGALSAREVAVVGAGVGGLSAAIELAAAGARVTVLERAGAVGGKAGRLRADGFAWDTGPTLLTMPEAIDASLGRAGLALRAEVDLAPLDPLCRYRFASGASFDHRAGAAETAQGIARFAPDDAARWGDFLAHARGVFDLVGDAYLRQPFEGMVDFAARVARRGVAAVRMGASFGTLDALAAQWFRSAEMRQFVARFATYAGASPAEASAAFAMIAHVESRGDAAYPRGGMHAIVLALARAATRLGATIELGAPVARVAREGARWRVTHARGAVACDAVVLNVDPAYAAVRLLDPALPCRDALARDGARPRSLSGVAILLGLRGETPGLAMHNVFFPRDYPAEFADVMQRRVPPRDGTVYVAAPSRLDPSAAPPGCEALFALVNAPARTDLDWDREVPRLRAHVLAKLAQLDPGVASRVVCERALTPRELAATGSLDGAIYGAAPHGARGPFLRPAQRVARAPGLYLAGGATHPGGGVPMAALSGRYAARLLAEDWGATLAPPAEARA